MGREAEGQTRLVSGQRSLFLFVTQEAPLMHVRITDVRQSSHHHLTSSSVAWKEVFIPSCLPSERQRRREGRSIPLALAGSWFLSHWSPKHSTGHGGSCAVRWGGVGWGGVGWGGVGGLLQIPAVPSSDTSLKSVKSWTGDCVCECMHVRVYVRNGACACAWT